DATTLAPDASTECTATYTVTQADLDAGTAISNTATATGEDPTGESVTSSESTATVTVDQSASLSVVKSANVASVDAAGDTITYTFTVTNTGNATIRHVVIHETSFSGTGTLSAIKCPKTRLSPGESMTCRARYKVTKADLQAGTLKNRARAIGSDAAASSVTSNVSGVVIETGSASASADTGGYTVATSHRVLGWWLVPGLGGLALMLTALVLAMRRARSSAQ
ncbi:MAG: hypothetical protein QM655_08365, partial [Nocardioidaceae bacterium]